MKKEEEREEGGSSLMSLVWRQGLSEAVTRLTDGRANTEKKKKKKNDAFLRV